MSLRDQILEADDLDRETVDLSDIKGYEGISVQVRSMSAKARSEMLAGSRDADGNVDLVALYPLIVVATAHNAEGEQLFTPADADALNTKHAGLIERLASAGLRVSGLTEEASDEAGKDSPSTPSGGSTSD